MALRQPRARDRVTRTVLVLLALTIGSGVMLRVRWLEHEMLSRWRVVLEGGSLTTQATVDEWFVERTADADALAQSVAVHASLPPAAANVAPPLQSVLTPLMRRGRFVRAWIVDSTGRVLAQSHPDTLHPAERAVLAEALASGRTERSTLIPEGPHAAYLSFAAQVRITGTATTSSRVPAAVVLRSDVVRAFSPWAAGRPNAAMSLLATPDSGGAVLIAACPERAIPVCISRSAANDHSSPSALALAGRDTFGVFTDPAGLRVLAHTRYDETLRWGVVRRVQYRDAVVPLHREFLIEGAFLAVLIALAWVGAYAADRGRRARRLGEQRDAAQRLRAVVDASTDGIVSLDAAFLITMTNDAVDRLLGRSPVSRIGKSVLTLFPKEWHATITDDLEAFARSDSPHGPLAGSTRCIALRHDGLTLPVEVSVGRAMLSGEPVFVLGLRDISERVRAEEFVRGQRVVLELIAGGAPASETISKLLSVIETEAPAMRCAVYEYIDSPSIARIIAAPGLPLALVDRIRELPIDADTTGIGAAIYRDERVASTNFSTDPLWSSASPMLADASIRAGSVTPLKSADGRMIGALACFYEHAREGTPREWGFASAASHLASIALASARLRVAEGALRRSERLAAVGKLVSGVAHELNNPLSSIMHFTEDLLSDPRSPQDREALGIIRDQARRSRTIVRDLLSFVQQRRVSGEPLCLNEVVLSTTLGVRPTLAGAGVTLHVAESERAMPLLADRVGIQQIVVNLITNAAYAAGAGGEVWIRTEEMGENWHLVVEDSGPGIADDVLSHIFDPFFTTKPTGEGTGLGLSVTLGIVEQLDGRIQVDQGPGGRGARFTVVLPRLGVTSGAARTLTPVTPGFVIPSVADIPVEALAPRPVRTALIIDDEPTIRAALKRYFSRREWAVREAKDGQEGLAILREGSSHFDVVISDLRMPGLSGIELHDILLNEDPALLGRFVFSTGDVASGNAASFVQRTSCPVLQKPFELRMLDEIIATLGRGTTAEHMVV